MERGWAINVGGGFCAYADLTLLIDNLFKFYRDQVKKVLIVDLDAHQVRRKIEEPSLFESWRRAMDTNGTFSTMSECLSWTCTTVRFILVII